MTCLELEQIEADIRAEGEIESWVRYRALRRLRSRHKIGKRLRAAVFARDGRRCRRCGSTTWDLHLDHVVPIVGGGQTVIDNLQVLCSYCNASKGCQHVLSPADMASITHLRALETPP